MYVIWTVWINISNFNFICTSQIISWYNFWLNLIHWWKWLLIKQQTWWSLIKSHKLASVTSQELNSDQLTSENELNFPQAFLFLSFQNVTNSWSAHLASQSYICTYTLLKLNYFIIVKKSNAHVRVELIPHTSCHYLAVAGYRHMVKTREQGRIAELIYWKCT